MITNQNDLYDYLIKRGVTRLCHFTKIKSFVHILNSNSGILATNSIALDVKAQNDLCRCDGNLDYICCSIEYPNSWYWGKVKERDDDVIFRDWVILCIDLDILKYQKIKFSPCNAAFGNGRYIKEKISEFSTLFDTIINIQGKIRQRTSEMLTCCPTDDQAEILVHTNVPWRYINCVIVGNESTAENIYAILKTCHKKLNIIIAPDVCNTRWSFLVRRGLRPIEEKYTVM